jgi:hypothetical protein
LAFVRLKALWQIPGFTLVDWMQCVENLFQSDDARVGDMPQDFIPYLSRYRKGPLNQFHQLREVPNGRNNVNPRTARNRAAGEQVDREIERAFRGAPESDSPGSERNR